MMFKRAAAVAATLAITVAAAVGCSSPQAPLTYAPAAYGVPGQCYYVDDPAEAIALRAAGLCPASWAPTLMPLSWHEEYWDYYDSPAYYSTYVPARIRTVYVQQETTFGHTYRSAITTRSRTASYRSSSRSVVKGSTLTGKTQFGSGTSFGTTGQKYGGGSLRSGGSAGSGSSRTGSVSSRSGSSGSRSGGFGGGSLRSGRSH